MVLTPVEISLIGWFVSPMIKVLIDAARSCAKHQYKMLRGCGKDLDRLAVTLDLLMATANAIQTQERLNHPGGGGVGCLQQIKDAMDEVEDVMDRFRYQAMESELLKKESKGKHALHACVALGRRSIGFDDAYKELRQVLDKVVRVQQDARDFVQVTQLEVMSSMSGRISLQSGSSTPRRLVTGHFLPEGGLFGYDDEYRRLVSSLSLVTAAAAAPGRSRAPDRTTATTRRRRRQRDARVVVVIGRDGMGKTTLAQRAWNDAQQARPRFFDLIIWASVSYMFTADDILREIWKSTPGPVSEGSMSFANLQQALADLVKSKQRYLLILDDVCSDELAGELQRRQTWDQVLAPFRQHGEEEGSRILVTTRSEAYSKMFNARTNIKLKGISTGQLLLLLKTSAFGSATAAVDDDKLLEKVASKLNGSPFAAKSVGEKMKNMTDERAREEFLQDAAQNGWAMPVHESSYQSLPQHLQFCLAFCSIFPQNWEFEPSSLVKMWIAQGFLDDKKNLEDVGRDYLSALLSRSFFQARRRGATTYYVIHEDIHLMVQSASGNYCVRLQQPRTNTTNIDIVPSTTRHLSVTSGCTMDQLKTHPEPKRLRTLLVFNDPSSPPLSSIDQDVLAEFKGLRVLDLTATSIVDLPAGAIAKLRHLRYLALPSTLSRLPTAVTKLLHLQTFSLSMGCRLHDFPPHAVAMNNLINLRYLDMDPRYIAMIGGIGRLVQLRGSVELSCDMGHSHGIEELSSMNCLNETLCIRGLNSVANKEAAQKAQLASKQSVKVLKLEWKPSAAVNPADVVEGLQPHPNLEELHVLRYQGVPSPSWLGSNLLQKLRSLYLENCRNWRTLPPLGQLPRLKVLQMREMHSVAEIDGSGLFKALETIVLLDMPQLVGWTDSETTTSGSNMFPRLKELKISNCPKLKLMHLQPVPSTVRNMKIQSTAVVPGYLKLYPSSSRSNRYTVKFSGEAELLREGLLLHGHHIKATEALHIMQCTSPDVPNIHRFTSLRRLLLNQCSTTGEGLSRCMQQLQSCLHSLDLQDCPIVTSFSLPEGCSPVLQMLQVQSCSHLSSLSGLGCCHSLRLLHMEKCPALTAASLPPNFGSLSSLAQWRVHYCSEFEAIPEGGLPPSLVVLELAGAHPELAKQLQDKTRPPPFKCSFI